MKVLWLCVCACLAVTVVGKGAEEAVGKLKLDDTERQEFPSTMEPFDTTTRNIIDIITDSATDSSTDKPEITTTPESSSTSTTTTTTTSTTTTPSPTSDPMTSSSPPVGGFTLPVDCADLLMSGITTSGVYYIYPFTCTCSRPVKVWCDMETDGGGWTVFLKRQRQTEQLDFNRTWEDYKEGFGDPDEEYWLGMEMLHVMTYGRTYSLRLDVEASGTIGYATRANMKVDAEDNRYRITSNGRESGSSNTRYCLRYMNYRSFTTIDRDYDSYRGNCAAGQGGAWWYYNCRYFNPTSIYTSAINMTCYGSSNMNVTRLQLKIRPAICESPLKAIHLREMACGC